MRKYSKFLFLRFFVIPCLNVSVFSIVYMVSALFCGHCHVVDSTVTNVQEVRFLCHSYEEMLNFKFVAY